jgi:vacuolar-type H+-ATPase subunit I/STV1
MATNQFSPQEGPSERPDDGIDHADAESARIAELQAEVDDLETELERERQRRQAIIQRYEHLLDERACEPNEIENESGGLLSVLRR